MNIFLWASKQFKVWDIPFEIRISKSSGCDFDCSIRCVTSELILHNLRQVINILV